MKFVRQNVGDAEVPCPCRICLNREHLRLDRVEHHLLMNGMASTYDKWIHHGEIANAETPHAQPDTQAPPAQPDTQAPPAEPDAQAHMFDGLEEDDQYEDDRIPDLLQDLYNAENHDEDHGDGEASIFAKVLEEMKQALQEGGKFSRFSFTVKLLHIKSFYRISNVAFNAILQLLVIQFPNSTIPKSYDEALSIIRGLGLGYVSIHVCPNNCVLFRKAYKHYDKCPICDASRYKDADGRKRIPEKVLRHFPLIRRLRRIILKPKTAEEVRWHKEKRQPVDNELTHPADGEAWKAFDREHKDFAADPRNIRLGMATDGFNPFNNMANSYSMWPVFVMNYNLPPWACMDQSNFRMVLLIPGRQGF